MAAKKTAAHGPQGPAYTNRIVCAKRGCNVVLWTKAQDAFQVRYCVEHQAEQVKARRSERAKAKRLAAMEGEGGIVSYSATKRRKPSRTQSGQGVDAGVLLAVDAASTQTCTSSPSSSTSSPRRMSMCVVIAVLPRRSIRARSLSSSS
jgi:hypothetical protein